MRKNGTLGSLFINKKAVVPVNVWILAKDCKSPGYAHRPGWHVLARPVAPHLSKKGRVWASVTIMDYRPFKRPSSQGGLWYLANKMKVNKVLGRTDGNVVDK
jgi:hypothetical protein